MGDKSPSPCVNGLGKTLCPGGGAFDSLFCPKGRVLYTMIVPGGGFCPLRVVSREFVLGGMVLNEIDACIMQGIPGINGNN